MLGKGWWRLRALVQRVCLNLRSNKSEQLELELFPGYAPVRAGHVVPGDDAPTSEVLNELIQEGPSDKLRELFGTAQPMRITWSFSATNVLTGTRVPVSVGTGTSGAEIKVTFVSAPFEKSKLQITFPDQPERAIYEVVATATVKDSFENSGQDGPYDFESRVYI